MKKRLLLITAVLLIVVLLAATLPALFKQANLAQKTTAANNGGYYVATLSSDQPAYRTLSSGFSKAIVAGIIALASGGIGLIVSALKKPKDTKQIESIHFVETTEVPDADMQTLKPKTIVADRYVIEDVLGFGEYGATYSAQDRATGSRVAFIEYLPANTAKREPGGISLQPLSKEKETEYESGKAEFMEDANSLTYLGEDSYQAKILDRFEKNGTAYCVSEHLENIPLEQYIPNAFYDSEWMKKT